MKEEAKRKTAENKRIRAMRKVVQMREKTRKQEEAAEKKRNKTNKECYACKKLYEDEEKSEQKLWTFCRDCNLWCCAECVPDEFSNDRKKFICNICALEMEATEEARSRLEDEINVRVQAN
jgi:hypothetical protein